MREDIVQLAFLDARQVNRFGRLDRLRKDGQFVFGCNIIHGCND